MKTGISAHLSRKAGTFSYHTLAVYLLLIFLFISNFLAVYNVPYVNNPFNGVTIFITRFACRLFFGRQLVPYPDFHDHYWTYAALLCWLMVALAAALVWSIWGKAKKDDRILSWARLVLRYYLAAVLLGYGISKLLADQFSHVDYTSLIQPIGNLSPDLLFWKLVGASRSYQIFSGAVETLAGILLLFRRTSTAGCLLAITLLVNVLMIDVAYDIFVKARVLYFITLAAFLSAGDLKKIIQLLAFRGTVTLEAAPGPALTGRWAGVLRAAKVVLIFLVLAVIIKKQAAVYHYYHRPLAYSLAGIFQIEGYRFNDRPGGDSTSWRRLAINRYSPRAAIELASGAFIDCTLKADTARHSLELTPMGNRPGKYLFYYRRLGPARWEFQGAYQGQEIRFRSQKVNENSIPLTRAYGRVVWDF